ncbi:MAG: phosphoribosyltransferase [Cycloclasticus sp.]|nr:MAG: phosphoribosyltransferase [Cycloclasticus sp.]
MSKLIPSKVNIWLNNAQTYIYPHTCFLCDQPSSTSMDLCTTCLNDFHSIDQRCTYCDIELSGVSLVTTNLVCGRCLKTTPYYDKIRTLYRYSDATRFLIQSLKFNAKHSCARTIGTLMARHFSHLNEKPDALIAVPLHPKRLIERGFNQSDLIAQYIQQTLDVPMISHQLQRVTNTVSQSTLKAPERRKNLTNAFRYELLKTYPSIAVIDDVVTTGSTANEIAKTLKKAGVKRVEIWAFARA